MADEIKDYKKGLSKIGGQGEASGKVSPLWPFVGAHIGLHAHKIGIIISCISPSNNRLTQVVFSNLVEVPLPTMNASTMLLI
jgi:hypothetical protein